MTDDDELDAALEHLFRRFTPRRVAKRAMHRARRPGGRPEAWSDDAVVNLFLRIEMLRRRERISVVDACRRYAVRLRQGKLSGLLSLDPIEPRRGAHRALTAERLRRLYYQGRSQLIEEYGRLPRFADCITRVRKPAK